MLLRAPLTTNRSLKPIVRSSMMHGPIVKRAKPPSTVEPPIRSFGSSHDGPYSVSILGDLHLEPAQMHLFHDAREQLLTAMSDNGQPMLGARVVQLGDLGGYQHKPGSRACFQVAKDYLSAFNVPIRLITGNHDLEGEEFEEDIDNLSAWQQAFEQHHYWAEQLGPVLCIGLSTVRFRSNKHSVHEVYIDDEQMAWFEQVLLQNADKPIVIFTHAPPMGSGLKVVENVHVKNRCAWLNHSDRPQRFIRMVEQHSNIKLWFSGHYHLSQNYIDSISVVGSCAFVQTGVIGECNRDGHRQSRLLRFDQTGYQLFTVDHIDKGRLRLDLQHSWGATDSPQPVIPEHELIPDDNAGWLRSHLDCGITDSFEEANRGVQWMAAGPNVLLAVQQGMVVEYDVQMRSPVGVVAFLEEEHQVSLVTADGGSPQEDDGSDAAALVLYNASTKESKRLERNDSGGFYRIFQHNKWVAKKQAEAASKAASQPAPTVLVSSS